MPRAPAFPERHPFHITFFRAGFQPHNTLGCPYHFPFSLRLAYGKSAYPERYGSRYAPPAQYCESSRGAPLRFDARLNGRGQSTSSHIRQRTLPYHGLQRPCYALCVLCGIFSVWVVAYLFTCKSIYSADLEAPSAVESAALRAAGRRAEDKRCFTPPSLPRLPRRSAGGTRRERFSSGILSAWGTRYCVCTSPLSTQTFIPIMPYVVSASEIA